MNQAKHIYCQGCGRYLTVLCDEWDCLVIRLAVHQHYRHNDEPQNYTDIDRAAASLELMYENM